MDARLSYIVGGTALGAIFLTKIMPEWASNLLGSCIIGALLAITLWANRASAAGATTRRPRNKRSWRWSSKLTIEGGMLAVPTLIIQTLGIGLDLAPQAIAFPVWLGVLGTMYLAVLFCLDFLGHQTRKRIYEILAVVVAIIGTYVLYLYWKDAVTELAIYLPRLVPTTLVSMGATILIEVFGTRRLPNIFRRTVETITIGIWAAFFIANLLRAAVLHEWITRFGAQAIIVIAFFVLLALIAGVGLAYYISREQRASLQQLNLTPAQPNYTYLYLIAGGGVLAAAMLVFGFIFI